MNKVCVYTCITGDYDNLKEIKRKEKDIDYYCFTNNPNIKSDTWNVVYIEEKGLPNVLLARKTKILGHPIINDNYDILLWMDAAVEFNTKIMTFINNFLGKNDSFVCFKHGERKSILEEMNACVRFRKEKREKVEKLQKFYAKEKYNYDNGLIESTVLIKRPKDEKVIETMDMWYKMVRKYSKRDQLSFNYCAYKTNLKIKWIDEKVFDNKWFKWFNHNSNNKIDEYIIYYGDINDNYDYRNQFINNYKIQDNIYIIEEKLKKDTDVLYVELSNVSMVKYNIKSININKSDINYINSIKVNDDNIFYNTLGAIIINKPVKKGDKLHIEIEFEKLENYDIMYLANNIISEYEQKKIIYKALEHENLELKNFYNKKTNSIFNKVKQKIKKIFHI